MRASLRCIFLYINLPRTSEAADLAGGYVRYLPVSPTPTDVASTPCSSLISHEGPGLMKIEDKDLLHFHLVPFALPCLVVVPKGLCSTYPSTQELHLIPLFLHHLHLDKWLGLTILKFCCLPLASSPFFTIDITLLTPLNIIFVFPFSFSFFFFFFFFFYPISPPTRIK